MQVHASTAIMCRMYSGQCECRWTNMQLYTNMFERLANIADINIVKTYANIVDMY